MSEDIKRLQEGSANIWEEAKGLLDAAEAEKRDLTGEEEGKYQALNADLDAIDARTKDMVEAEQRAKDAEAAFSGLLAKPQERGAVESKDSELRRFARGEIRSMEVGKPEGVSFRDLTKGAPSTVINTVPTTFYGRLMQHLIEVSGLMSANPTVLNTSSGENIDIPITTSFSSAAITPENTAIPQSEPAFGKRTLGAYKYGCCCRRRPSCCPTRRTTSRVSSRCRRVGRSATRSASTPSRVTARTSRLAS